ncbi:hypothetical protein WA158_003599 [Blastocystis sp. Blastoise]
MAVVTGYKDIENLLSIISSTSDNWQYRIQALESVETLAKTVKLHSQLKPYFLTKELIGGLFLQFGDLNVKVKKASSEAITSLYDVLPKDMIEINTLIVSMLLERATTASNVELKYISNILSVSMNQYQNDDVFILIEQSMKIENKSLQLLCISCVQWAIANWTSKTFEEIPEFITIFNLLPSLMPTIQAMNIYADILIQIPKWKEFADKYLTPQQYKLVENRIINSKMTSIKVKQLFKPKTSSSSFASLSQPIPSFSRSLHPANPSSRTIVTPTTSRARDIRTIQELPSTNNLPPLKSHYKPSSTAQLSTRNPHNQTILSSPKRTNYPGVQSRVLAEAGISSRLKSSEHIPLSSSRTSTVISTNNKQNQEKINSLKKDVQDKANFLQSCTPPAGIVDGDILLSKSETQQIHE